MQEDRRRLPAPNRLVAFDATARRLSFAKAAQENFLTHSAVTRQIAVLEDEFGSVLLLRQHRALELTADGVCLAAAVSQALAGVREAVAAIRSPCRRDVLTVITTSGFASLSLIPRLAGLVAEHPGTDVRIDVTLDLLIEQEKRIAPFKGQAASERGYFVMVYPDAAARLSVRTLVKWLHAQAQAEAAEARAAAALKSARPAAMRAANRPAMKVPIQAVGRPAHAGR